jgi:hypothetical protein
MIHRRPGRVVQAVFGAVLGLASVALVSATPAAAQATCSESQLGVTFTGISISQQGSGANTTFLSNATTQVFCDLDGNRLKGSSEPIVPNSGFEMWITWTSPLTFLNSRTYINNQLANSQATAARIDAGADGIATFVVSAPFPLTAGGTTVQVKSLTSGQVSDVNLWVAGDPNHQWSYDSPLHFDPWATLPSMANTPELGSLALFAAGAVGMAGYATTRLRSRRAGQRPEQDELAKASPPG